MRLKLECTNQFMMKSRDRDMPRMLPFQKFTLEVDFPIDAGELTPYLQTYLDNKKIAADAESTGSAPELKPYNPPRELAKKWRKKVRNAVRGHNSDVQDLFKLSDDEAIEQGIVLMVDYGIDDVIDDAMVDKLLAQAGIPIPPDTETEYLANKMFRVVGWNI